MKKYFLAVLTFLIALPVFSADFTMRLGSENTIAVDGCGRGEVGKVEVISSISGEHRLTARCLAVYCVYTNETSLPLFGTKWTIKLTARDPSTESGRGYGNYPHFDRRFEQILHKGIPSKEERDMILKKYMGAGTCKEVYFDRNVPSA